MTPILEVIRLEETTEFGTFGVLKINKQLFCCTLEPPDNENAQNISSIPAQQYLCKHYSSEKYPNTFEITKVPGRTNVLFHSGNVDEHTAGCILLGEKFGKLKENRAILNSGNTFKAFMDLLGGFDTLHLTIKEVY